MAGVTLNPVPPVGPSGRTAADYVEYETFIEAQIAKTRRRVKAVELAYALMQLAIGLLAYVLVVVLLDHWVVPGGLGLWGRLVSFAGLICGAGAFVALRIVPLFSKRVNAIYAAHSIEQTQPTLKNSLVNFLLLKRHRGELAEPVFDAIERKAAADLAEAPVDAAVDRSHLIKLGYVLFALVLFCCLYELLSPKDPLRTFTRLAAPWANLAPPTRVTIANVEPGSTKVFHGESVKVSAYVTGLRKGEPVTLYYTTADGQSIDAPLAMRLPEDRYRHEIDLPGDAAGLQQTIHYFINAGDATTPRYRIDAVTAPAILVERVQYDYPAYAEVPPRVVERQGDIQGIEGTKITLHARANVPIQKAYVDFDSDGGANLPLALAERTASGSFVLELKDGQPMAKGYQIRFVDRSGHENPQPIRHSIEIVPDLPPEIEMLAPAKDEVSLPVNGALAISLRAADRDFKLRRVKLFFERRGAQLKEETLLDSAWSGVFKDAYVFEPAKLALADLKPGDEISYWAEARDNRAPVANHAETVKYRIKLVEPATKEAQERQQQQARQQAEEARRPNEPGETPSPNGEGNPQGQQALQQGAGGQQGDADSGQGGNDQQSPGGRDTQAVQQTAASESDPEADATQAMERILEYSSAAGQDQSSPANSQQSAGGEQNQAGQDSSGGTSQAGDENESTSSSTSRRNQSDSSPSQPRQEQSRQQSSPDGGQRAQQPNESPSGGADSQQQQGEGQGEQSDQESESQSNGEPGESPSASDQQQSQQDEQQAGGQSGQQGDQGGSQNQSGGQQKSGQQGGNQSQSASQSQSQSGENQESSSGGQPQNRSGDKRGGQQSSSGNQPGEQSSDGQQGQQSQGKSQSGGGSSRNKGQQQSGEGGQQGEGEQPREGQQGQGQGKKQQQARGGDKSKSKQPSASGDGQEQQGEGEGNSDSAQGQGKNSQGGGKRGGGSRQRGQRDGEPTSEPRQSQTEGGQEGNASSGDDRAQESNEGGGDKQSKNQQGRDGSGKGDGQRGDKQSDQATEKNETDKNKGNQKQGQGGQSQSQENQANNESKSGQSSARQGGQSQRSQGNQPGKSSSGKGQKGRQQDASGQGDKAGDKSGLKEKNQPEQGQKQETADQTGGDSQNQKGDSGAGQSSNQNNPSPQNQGDNRARDKDAAQNPSQSDQQPDEANSPSNSNTESNSQGGESGDRSGGGRKGGGQKANQQGTGSAGQNTAADQGAGQAQSAGQGETSNAAGDSAAGEQPQQGEGQQTQGQGRKAQPGSGNQQSGGNQATAGQGGHSSGGDQASASEQLPEGQPAKTDASQRQGRERQAPQSNDRPASTDEGGANPGGELERPGDARQATVPTDPDAPNLEYAKKATDLILDSLKHQLDKDELDEELLKKLNWTRDDVKKFVARWDEMRKAAAKQGPEGERARKELEKALGSLHLKRRRVALEQQSTGGDDRNMRETRWTNPPSEYAEQFRAYTEGAARQGQR